MNVHVSIAMLYCVCVCVCVCSVCVWTAVLMIANHHGDSLDKRMTRDCVCVGEIHEREGEGGRERQREIIAIGNGEYGLE